MNPKYLLQWSILLAIVFTSLREMLEEKNLPSNKRLKQFENEFQWSI